jgi:hypothetical protein
MLRGAVVVVAGLLIGLILWSLRPRPRAADREIGSALAKAALLDPAGRPVRRRSLLGRRATVLVFSGIDCPLGNLYMPHLAEPAQSYRGRGVVSIGINSHASESAEQVLAHAHEYRATFRSSVALTFAHQPVTREATTIAISRRDFVIPAGADNHEVRSEYTFDREVYLASIMPHMHLRGKDFRYRITFPDGRSETLLSVPAYDFAWQTLYRLAKPIRMPPGTRIDCLAHFDNSIANPANPDPAKTVTWGDQTWDEMMIGFTDYAVDLPVPSFAARSAAAESQR